MQIKEANKEHKPLPPLPESELSKLRQIQDLLDQKVSYRALGRAFGLTKVQLKEIQRFNTGRFYFVSAEDNAQSKKVLRAERADPVTAKLSSPRGVPKFSSASDGWAWLESKRLMERWMSEQPQTPLDPTPAGL